MESLKTLNKYIKVLVNEYPVPITQSELANKSSVTKSAVSKIRDRLLELCDMRIIAYERKMVLKSDFETFAKVFHLYFLHSKARKLFNSKYTKAVLDETRIYEEFTKKLEAFSFSKYFNKDDINWAINLVLQNVSSFQIRKDSFSAIASVIGSEIEDKDLTEIVPYIQLATKLLTNFEITLENEVELKKTLLLRDKAYFFIKNNLNKIIAELEVVKEIEDSEERHARINLLYVIAEHYMNKIFKQVTEHIQQQSKGKGILFLTDYNKIGALFKGSAGR